MKYILEPQNEGQGMNARTIFIGNRKAAMEQAFVIASTIQKLLPNCTITCQIQTGSQGLRGTAGIIAFCDGTFVDSQSGDFTKQ
jgi:hypothetical protein